ncbi:MAG: type II toxin-antitoxin system VapC family toxin [Rhodospirillaceae bacterium]
MVILDTNVLSELMKPGPDPAVLQWFLSAEHENFATTAITLAELRAGIAILPPGKRQLFLSETLNKVLASGTGLPVLGFGEEAAETYATLVLMRRRSGLHIDIADLMIASICAMAGAKLATRNVKDFAGTTIEIIDPWKS